MRRLLSSWLQASSCSRLKTIPIKSEYISSKAAVGEPLRDLRVELRVIMEN